jgi:DNA-binding transcriptional LysR family regulator
MHLSDLELYKTFYEYRNLSEVAERCSLSQPTVSYRLKKIEEELGIKLYTFDGRYHFTENGIRFYEFCTASTQEFHGFLENLERRRELHVSLSSVATIYYMESIYDLLQEEGWYPVISTASSAEAIRNVADGHSAFGIVGGVKNTRMPAQVAKQRIVNEEIVLVYNASLPEDIAYIPILLDDRQSGLNPLTVDYLKQQSGYTIAGEIGKSFEKLALVAHHPVGIFIPAEYRRYINTNHQEEVRISRKYSFHRDLYIVYHREHYPELADRFIEKLNRNR